MFPQNRNQQTVDQQVTSGQPPSFLCAKYRVGCTLCPPWTNMQHYTVTYGYVSAGCQNSQHVTASAVSKPTVTPADHHAVSESVPMQGLASQTAKPIHIWDTMTLTVLCCAVQANLKAQQMPEGVRSLYSGCKLFCPENLWTEGFWAQLA